MFRWRQWKFALQRALTFHFFRRWGIKNCSQTSKEVFALLVCLVWHSKSQEYSIFQMTSVSHPFFESSQVCLKLRSVPLSLYRPYLAPCLQIWAHWRIWVWKVNKYTQFWKHLTCLFKLGCKHATTKQWKMQIQSVETLKTWLVDVCCVLFWIVFSSRLQAFPGTASKPWPNPLASLKVPTNTPLTDFSVWGFVESRHFRQDDGHDWQCP